MSPMALELLFGRHTDICTGRKQTERALYMCDNGKKSRIFIEIAKADSLMIKYQHLIPIICGDQT